MKRPDQSASRFIRFAAALGAICTAAGMPAWADEPTALMRNVMSATVAEVTLYDVRPDQAQAFLDAMVHNGPYNQLMSGAVSEKLLAPLPGSGAGARYVSFSRYLDGVTARRVSDIRDRTLPGVLNSAPERVSGTLVQHVFADWGWEKGRAPKMMDVFPTGSEVIFEQRLTTLSYLKTGYTGQAGMVEFFDSSYTPDRLRAMVTQRAGLTGASIYVTPTKSYFVYSEYFSSPAHAARATAVSSVNRAQAGTVEVNYAPR